LFEVTNPQPDQGGLYPVHNPRAFPHQGTERLRLTPSPVHSDSDIDMLVDALTGVRESFTLRNAA
jgi:5-aminolevulinate synthase